MERDEINEATASFLAWERASRDVIDFKKIYVDIAEDLVSGLVLSQIVYWHLPGHDGVTKLRVSHDGEMWIAKTAKEWYDEIRVTGKQVDRALAVLSGTREPRLGKPPIIATAVFKFNGAPTKHIRLLWENTLEIVTSSILPKGQNPFYPKVKMDLPQRSKSLTETTTKTTNKNTNTGKANASPRLPVPKPSPKAVASRQPTLKGDLFVIVWQRSYGGIEAAKGRAGHDCGLLVKSYPDVTPLELTAFCDEYARRMPNKSLPRSDNLAIWFGTYLKEWSAVVEADYVDYAGREENWV